MRLLAEDCVKFEDRFYFCSINSNFIFSVDDCCNGVRLEDCFPSESIKAQRLCSKMLLWKNVILFVPMNAKKLWIWNPCTKEWHGIEIPTLGVTYNKFFQAIVYSNNLYLIGCTIPGIVCVNLEKETVHEIFMPFDRLAKKRTESGKPYFRCNYELISNCVYMASCVSNEVMEFNLMTEEVSFYKAGDSTKKYVGICYNDDFWLLEKNKLRVVRWNKEKQLVREYQLLTSEAEPSLNSGIFVSNRDEFIIARRMDGSYKFRIKEEDLIVEKIDQSFLFLKVHNGNMIYFDTNSVFTFHNGNSVLTCACVVDKDQLCGFISEHMQLLRDSISENIEFGLVEYLKTI